MNVKMRLTGTIALGAAFFAVIFWYSFTQRFIPEAVNQPIPSQATFSYQADTLKELLQSPLCNQLDNALGAGNSLKEISAANDWTKLAVASEIAIADIPFRTVGQSKTWAAVSWVGWRSPWLRWKLDYTSNEHLQFIGKHAVWPVWQYDAPDLARGMSLTFALTDNLFIACLSENSSDIILLLDTYDRRTPKATKL